MTYAVIQTGSKQYKVSQGDRILVEKLSIEAGKDVHFDQVLLVGGEEKTRLGTPFLTDARVSGKVLAQEKGKKLILFKYKKRKGYDKKQGHRQQLTRVEITEIKG